MCCVFLFISVHIVLVLQIVLFWHTGHHTVQYCSCHSYVYRCIQACPLLKSGSKLNTYTSTPYTYIEAYTYIETYTYIYIMIYYIYILYYIVIPVLLYIYNNILIYIYICMYDIYIYIKKHLFQPCSPKTNGLRKMMWSLKGLMKKGVMMMA